jgi:hypothetical protein
MRVTIEHREETAGLTGSTKHYFVDCRVQFTEEEQFIIQARDLFQLFLKVGYAIPPVTKSDVWATEAAFITSKFAMLVGFPMWSGAGLFGASGWSAIGFLLAFGGLAVYAYIKLMVRKEAKMIATDGQNITVKDLIAGKTITVYAYGPAELFMIEEDIKRQLLSLKHYLTQSVELRTRETTEL